MSVQARSLFGDGGELIFDTIKRNPEGLLLLAAGAVLMMRTNAPRQPRFTSSSSCTNEDPEKGSPLPEAAADIARQKLNQAESSVSDAARRTMDTAKSYASSASDAARQTMDTAKSYVSSASEYANTARNAVEEQSERVAQQTQSLAQRILQDQPLAIAIAGLAAGVALAAAFPPTDVEKQTLGPVGDQMSKAAERVGDQLKQATMKAGETLKSAAEERGLHSESLKEVANEVAESFKATMRGQPEAAKENVPGAEGLGVSDNRSW